MSDPGRTGTNRLSDASRWVLKIRSRKKGRRDHDAPSLTLSSSIAMEELTEVINQEYSLTKNCRPATKKRKILPPWR